MEEKIIGRLIEINEKRSKSSDIKFFVACLLLLISLVGNIYQATLTGEIVIDADNNIESSIRQNNG